MVELEGINPEINNLYYRYINGFSQMLIALARHAFPDIKFDASHQEILGISFIGAMRQSATNWLMTDYKTDRALIVSATSQLFLGMISLIKS